MVMSVQQIREWAKHKGFGEPDRWGHMKLTNEAGWVYRLKFQARSIRLEYQLTHDDGSKEWRRKWTGFFKNLSINPESKRLQGMSR